MIAYNVLRIIGTEAMKKNDMPIRHKTIKRRRIRTVIERLMLIAGHLTVHARKIILALGRSSPWANTFIRIWRVLSEGWFVDFLNLTFWRCFYTLLTLVFPLFAVIIRLFMDYYDLLLQDDTSGCVDVFLWWVLRIEVPIIISYITHPITKAFTAVSYTFRWQSSQFYSY